MTRSISGVTAWGRRKLGQASTVFGLPIEDLVLVGGALSRCYRNLPASDLDFVSSVEFKTPQPTKKPQIESPRAFTFVDGSNTAMQLLKRWSGPPPYKFDWRHAEAYVTYNDYYFPGCFVTGKLEIGGGPLDQPAPLIRMVKWLQLGFTIEKSVLKELLSAAIPGAVLDEVGIWNGSA